MLLSVAALVSRSGSTEISWKLVVLPVCFAVPGALIAAVRPRVPIGWLLMAVALLVGGAAFGGAWATADRPGSDWAVWWTDRASAYAVPCLLLVLLLLPDGTLPSRRWRGLVIAVVGAQVLLVTAYVLTRGPAAGEDRRGAAELRALENPVGLLPARLDEVTSALEPWLLQAPLVLALVAIAQRLWRGSGDERRRLGEVLVAAGVLVGLSLLGHALWPAAADVLDVLGGALLGAAITVAVLRGRVTGLDVVVHHFLAYAVLTALIASGYVAMVASLAWWGLDLPPFGQGLLTAAIALVLLPVRGRLQRIVDAALYGDRRNPYAAVRRLDAELRGSTTLPQALSGLARTLTSALRVPWAAVEIGEHSAEHGSRRPGVVTTTRHVGGADEVPVVVSVVCPPGRRLTRHEQLLLDDLARQGSRTVTALLLAEALVASRQHLVTAREEERARLRRDLHDELGPTLAGLVMQLAGMRELIDEDPAVAAARVGRLEDAARTALDDVRRVSRALRPPALDELGLAGALRDHAARLGLDAPSPATPLPELPPAVEVAAYRIGAEALTNVARHARVTQAELAVHVLEGDLCLLVRDDGVGWGGRGVGVGVLGMRERAEEVGGRVDIESRQGAGTTVRVRIPLSSPAGQAS